MNASLNISEIEQYVIDYIRTLRHKKGLSQEDIAHILGITSAFIGNIESSKNRAKYNLNHINVLAEYFDLSPQEFLPKKAYPTT
ncbi:helix-turn-helix domain-containing protein [Polluticaenibacter yanchengensis]|uniref:Helix-turn-helix transcriptional regulator n=1 Tax=Polluticaenibacter yanchengensis TaxID=3014562 RepID=A0ABT4ULC3_9BACT|nr:helix-turn-helix transcriptional regulator [Chitinophagaceae bacterium LY-5]